VWKSDEKVLRVYDHKNEGIEEIQKG